MAKPKLFDTNTGVLINPDHVTSVTWNGAHTELSISMMGLREQIVIKNVSRQQNFLDIWSVE